MGQDPQSRADHAVQVVLHGGIEETPFATERVVQARPVQPCHAFEVRNRGGLEPFVPEEVPRPSDDGVGVELLHPRHDDPHFPLWNDHCSIY